MPYLDLECLMNWTPHPGQTEPGANGACLNPEEGAKCRLMSWFWECPFSVQCRHPGK